MTGPLPANGDGRPSPGQAPPREVDWAHLAARVEDVGRTLAEGAHATPEEVARELARRAAELASPAIVPSAAPETELLILEVGGRRFGLETRHVVEVVRQPPIAPLPGGAPPVVAVAAWRGRILTALDMRLSGSAGSSVSHPPLLVVLGGDGAELGLLADRAETVTSIPSTSLLPVPEGQAAWTEYMQAITPEALPVLDGDAILRRHPPDS